MVFQLMEESLASVSVSLRYSSTVCCSRMSSSWVQRIFWVRLDLLLLLLLECFAEEEEEDEEEDEEDDDDVGDSAIGGD